MAVSGTPASPACVSQAAISENWAWSMPDYIALPSRPSRCIAPLPPLVFPPLKPVQDQPVAHPRGGQNDACSLASERRFLYPRVDLAGGSRL
jgi:hypothetical protein